LHEAEKSFLGDVLGAGFVAENPMRGGINDAGISADDFGKTAAGATDRALARE
jgi:hypothetical protein